MSSSRGCGYENILNLVLKVFTDNSDNLTRNNDIESAILPGKHINMFDLLPWGCSKLIDSEDYDSTKIFNCNLKKKKKGLALRAQL